MFRDGMRDPGWYTRDMFNGDRVEVYKGPSAFAFGRGSTGGAINTVTKLPTGASFIEGTVTGTTGPGYRAEVDASGKKDNVSGRIAALYQDVDTPTRDHVDIKRWGVAPSVSVQIEPDQGDLQLHLPGRRERSGLRHHLSAATGLQPDNGRVDQRGLQRQRLRDAPMPGPRNNWYGIRERAAARHHQRRHAHRHDQDRA